jgi:drug/metabolite transporter (DMT)-like permease
MCGGGADFLGGLAARRLPSPVVVALSQAVALAVIAATVVAVRPDFVDWWFALWAGLAGCCMTLGLVTFYAALSAGTMGVVAPLSALGAMAVPLVWAFAALHESPGPVRTIGVAVSVVGVVLASGPEFTGGVTVRPVLGAALSGTCFGAMNAFLARASSSGVLWSAAALKVGVLVSLVPVLVVLSRRQPLPPAAELRATTRTMLAIGVLDVTGTVLLTEALSRGLVSLVSVVAGLYPLTTVLLARYVLAERLQRVQLAGVVGIVAGIGLISSQ